jgi:hypothetical protein
MAANIAGVALVLAITSIVALVVGMLAGGEAIDKVPSVSIVWIGLAVMQWLALRGRVPQSGWWILASVAGWATGFAIIWAMDLVTRNLLGKVADYEIMALVFALAVGAALGCMQWLVLRRHFSRAGWWVVSSTIGWLLAFLMIGKSVDRLADIVFLSAVPPAITGLALVWLLRRPRASEPGIGPAPYHGV